MEEYYGCTAEKVKTGKRCRQREFYKDWNAAFGGIISSY